MIAWVGEEAIVECGNLRAGRVAQQILHDDMVCRMQRLVELGDGI